jgi:hypothetical protein
MQLKRLVVTLTMPVTGRCSAADTVGEQCRAAFQLTGNVDLPWKDITLNNSNRKILPKQWIDKGGHFLLRMKERGDEVGILTPSDLHSFLLGTKAILEDKDKGRWKLQQNMGGKAASVHFDAKKASKCELASFIIRSK